MAESAGFKPVPASSDHIAAAPRADEPSAAAQASRPRPVSGQLRPSGASTGAALPLARPSAVPSRPIHDVLGSPGQPLAAPVRKEMEARLGADFTDVRIHTDSAARASAAEVGARAYTSGSHVVIGDGAADKHTLAHELIHVIQQRQGPVAGTDNGAGLRVSDPSDRFERAAEAAASRVMTGPLPGELITEASATAASAGQGGGAYPMPGLQRMAGNQATSRLLRRLPVQRKQYTEGSKAAPYTVSPKARSQAKWVIDRNLHLAANLAGNTVNGVTFFVVNGASPGTIGYEKFKGKTWCGGRQYMNNDSQLPGQSIYTEWDVQQYVPGSRGDDRVVVGSRGQSFYTADHYANFVELKSL